MNLRDGLHSIESIKFVVSTIKGLSKIAVAWEVLFLDFEIRRSAATVIHVICAVNRGPNV